MYSEQTPSEDTERAAICKPGRQAAGETRLDLDLKLRTDDSGLENGTPP